MKSITRFTLDSQTSQLHVAVSTHDKTADEEWCFPMEYLRVIDLSVLDKTAQQTNKKTPLVTNKKSVQLISIESVGKHGFRLIFDDQFQQICSVATIEELYKHQDELWQNYLDAVKASGYTRDSLIDIKAL